MNEFKITNVKSVRTSVVMNTSIHAKPMIFCHTCSKILSSFEHSFHKFTKHEIIMIDYIHRYRKLDIFNIKKKQSFRVHSILIEANRNEKNKQVPAKIQVCVVCMSNPLDVLFKPCNHLSTCVSCANLLLHNSDKHLRKCPICRAFVEDVEIVFI